MRPQLTDEELQRQYTNSMWNKRGPNGTPLSSDDNLELALTTLQKGSDAMRKKYNVRSFVYGTSPAQKIDMYSAEGVSADAPILIFVHGGYWSHGTPDIYNVIGTAFVEAGAVVAMVGYDICPAVTVAEICSMIKKAVRYILHMADKTGSRGIYLSGHSAGAHLVAMTMRTDWSGEFMKPGTLIKGAVLLSGIYDLEPMLPTTDGKAARLDEGDPREISPFYFADTICGQWRKKPILVCVGEYESPELHRQCSEFAEALRRGGANASELELPKCDHFTLVEEMTDVNCTLTKAMMSLMELKREAAVMEMMKDAAVMSVSTE